MDILRKFLAGVLCVLVVGPFAPAPALAQDSLVNEADLHAAIRAALADEEQARHEVRAVLERDDVRALAANLGFGEAHLRQASDAIDVLGAEELAQVHQNAIALDQQLEGGVTVTISLVALLLIVIIVILLVN